MPPRLINAMPLDSSESDCRSLNGTCQITRSFLSCTNRMREDDRMATVSSPGMSVTVSAGHVHLNKTRLTEMSNVRFVEVCPCVKVLQPTLAQCFSMREGLLSSGTSFLVCTADLPQNTIEAMKRGNLARSISP